jgi:hypothetical protein
MWPFSKKNPEKAALKREQFKQEISDGDVEVYDDGTTRMFSKTWSKTQIRKIIREEIAKAKSEGEI